MDAVLSIVGEIVVEGGKCLCAPVWTNIKNFYKFNSKVDNLENQRRRLLGLKKKIQDQLDLEEVDGMIRTPHVIMWLQKIEEESVASTLAKITNNKEKLNQLKQILDEGLPPQPLVMVDRRPKLVEERLDPSITSQDTSSKNLQKVIDELENDSVRVIGVWGMGGVGKTTFVNNLNDKLARSNNGAQPFGLAIWITISKDVDTKRIQERLAERLKLDMTGDKTIDGFGIRIYAMLMKERMFLLILDDIWERVDLDKVGILRPEIHRGYKSGLISFVCDQMGADEKLQVVPLSNHESLTLFSQTTGDVMNSGDVKPLAEAVAKECAGLPLAILVVGREMKGKTNIESWKIALRALERSNPDPCIPGVEKEVFLPLKFSYEYLANRNFRACFLCCCLKNSCDAGELKGA